MQALFYDPVAYKPYSKQVLDTEPLGGTEASVVRVAATLGATIEFPGGVAPAPGPFAHVVALRDPQALPKLRSRFPNARLWLWAHDLPSGDWARALLEAHKEASLSGLVCVSNWHSQQCLTILQAVGFQGEFQVRAIYNPVDDDLQPDDTPVDRNKLVWLASPHKGLDHALKIFENLRRFNPDFSLHIYNPGYLTTNVDQPVEATVVVGPQRHAAAMAGIRSALCLFSPNPVFPETMGLIYAESNAVGTPTLGHGIGALHEIVDLPSHELVDCHNPKAVIERVVEWYSGNRPTVRGKAGFRTSRVAAKWKELLR